MRRLLDRDRRELMGEEEIGQVLGGAETLSRLEAGHADKHVPVKFQSGAIVSTGL